MSGPGQHFVAGNRPAGPGLGAAWVGLCDTPPSGGLLLERAVAREVLPRLARRARSSALSVEAFSRLVIGKDGTAAAAYVERARAGGMTPDALYLELLAPAARHLGDLWSEDTVDFADVTIGVGRLHRVLRDLSPAFQAGAAPQCRPQMAPQDRQALLVTAPGESHSFGLAMVAEFFRRAGWVVWSGAPGAELTQIVRGNWFAVVGFSLACEARLDALRLAVARVRRASKNPDLRIMVGGPVFIEQPDLAAQVGADAMASDARQAVTRAQSLVASLPRAR